MFYENFFKGVPHVYCAKFMLTVSHNVNPVIQGRSQDFSKGTHIFLNPPAPA